MRDSIPDVVDANRNMHKDHHGESRIVEGVKLSVYDDTMDHKLRHAESHLAQTHPILPWEEDGKHIIRVGKEHVDEKAALRLSG